MEQAGRPAEGQDDPLLLTARMDDAAFTLFEAARRQHYPPDLNIVPAHIMLFHRLPGDAREEIEATLAELAAGQPYFEATVSGVQLLGRGVAYQVSAAALSRTHERLARKWDGWLSLQDRQSYRPHVVVQNKVHFEVARQLCESLSANFKPFPITITGLGLWAYRHGPWESLAEFSFS